MLFLRLKICDADLPLLYRIADNVVFDVGAPRRAPRVLVVEHQVGLLGNVPSNTFAADIAGATAAV